MPTAAPNFDQLTQHIAGLGPGQVQAELEPFLGNIGHRGVLGAVIARYQMDSSAQYDPIIGLLESVKGAIEQLGNPKLRAALGSNAVESVTGVFRNNDFQSDNYESVRLLAEWAGEFTGTQESPRDKSSSFIRISKAITDAGLRHAAGPDSPSLFYLSNEYLVEAAKAAKDTDDPSLRSHDLGEIAELSIGNYINYALAGAVADREDSEREQLADRMHEQSAWFYQEALAHAEDADLIERYDILQPRIQSMLASAARVRRASPELHSQLVNVSQDEIDKMLAQGSALAKLEPNNQAYHLADLGRELAVVIGQNYYDESDPDDESEPDPGSFDESASLLRQQLEERVMSLFRAARDKVHEPWVTRENYHPNLGGAPAKAMTAARVFFDRDFPKTKELVGIAFDLAVAEERDSTLGGIVSSTLGEVDHLARQADNVKAFELYRQAHELESSRLGEGRVSSLLRWNALVWMKYESRGPKRLPELDEGGRAFVEFAIQTAEYAEDVETVGRAFAGDPDLQQAVSERLEAMRTKAKAAKKKEPQSETERIARQLIQSL